MVKKIRTQFRALRHNSGCYTDGGHRDCVGGENLKQFESLDLICGPITHSGLPRGEEGRPRPSRADPQVESFWTQKSKVVALLGLGRPWSALRRPLYVMGPQMRSSDSNHFRFSPPAPSRCPPSIPHSEWWRRGRNCVWNFFCPFRCQASLKSLPVL